MNKNLTLFILTALILTAVASATVYEPNYVYDGNTKTALTGVSVIGFVCENDACTENTKLWNQILTTGNDNSITLQYPTELKSSYGYLIYFFKEGYVPYKVKADWSGEGKTKDYNDYLYKITDSASAQIDSLQLDKSSAKTGEAVKITADILSPRLNSKNVQFIPSALKKEFYSDDVKVTLSVNGNIVETKNLDMLWSTNKNIEFSHTFTQTGTYTIKLTTEITDDKFTNAKTEIKETQITVSQGNGEDTTAPEIIINSPESKEYHVSNIKFEITTNEALNSAWVVIDGKVTNLNKITNTKFSKTINLEDGSYTAVVYARDLAGNTAHKEITFSVKESENPSTEKANHNARFISDSYYDDKYFSQFNSVTPLTTNDNQIVSKVTTTKDKYYWAISLILILIILILIILILIFRRR